MVFFTRLAVTFHNLRCGSAMQKISKLFFCYCARLAVTFHNLRCGSAMQKISKLFFAIALALQ